MASSGMAPYITAHERHRDDPGYTGLCIAENLQTYRLLRPKLERIAMVPPVVRAYDQMSGRLGLRSAVAGLFEREIFGRPVDPAHVQVLAGAGSVLDCLGHALGDPGDVVIVPTPSYAGFWPDLEIRPGLSIVTAPTTADQHFRLTPAILQAAMERSNGRARVLLLTNPDNPRGQVMSAADLTAVLDWAHAQTGLHVIADEIYALSVFGDRPMCSAGALRHPLGDRLHVVWAFSKDFGMSGLRCGILISENEDLRRSIDLQSSWAGVSAHTQHVLQGMLEDPIWLQGYLGSMRRGLAAMAGRVTAALDAASIPHVRPEAGFFVLCDLRPFMDQPTVQAEDRLWRHLMDTARVNLTPGSALRSPDPGWFRLCYAANPPDVVMAAIGRVVEALA